MDQWWERFSGWVVAALFALTTTFLTVCRKQAKDDIDDVRGDGVKVQDQVERNRLQLADHETRLQLTNMQCDTMKRDLTEIKTSICHVHERISESNKALNGKLDRLLERGD